MLPNSLESQSHLGVPALGGGIGTGQAVVVEAVLTFFLVWVVFGTAVDPRSTFKPVAGLAIGLTITIDVLMGGVLTGRGDEPGPRVRSAARRASLGALVDLVRRPVRGRR